jgi:hypothetical protein
MNMYSAISRTQVQMVSSVDSIQGTFATFPESDHVFNLIFDIVGLAFAVGGAPVWSKCMETRQFTLPIQQKAPADSFQCSESYHTLSPALDILTPLRTL